MIGKSRSHVSNCLRLLKLPERTKSLLREGKISAGHARVLLSAAEPDALAEKIVAQNLSVRDAEAAESSGAKGQGPRKRGVDKKDADTRAMEKRLMEQLGMNVTITPREGEAGEVVVRYKTFDQLEFLCRRLQGD